MALFGERLIYSGQSVFAHYEIKDMTYNGRRARVLFGNDRSSQSGMALDDNPEMLFDYNQRFLEIAESLAPASIVIIGGGAFTLPQVLLGRLPGTTIDVVELDPLLPTLARDYFGLRGDPRLVIHTSDGLEYLRSSTAQYDLIILDVFSGYTIPEAFLTPEAGLLYQHRLSKNGYMAINFIASTTGRKIQQSRQLWTVFSSIFHDVTIYQADSSYPSWAEQNLIFVASNGEIKGLDYVQSVAVAIAPDQSL